MFDWVLDAPVLSSIHILFLKSFHKFRGFQASCLELIDESSQTVIRSSRPEIFYRKTSEKFHKTH